MIGSIQILRLGLWLLEDKDKINKPETFECPITKNLMIDPVLAPDGYTYERLAIKTWLKSNPTSPITRQPLHSYNLLPNTRLLIQIKQKYPIEYQALIQKSNHNKPKNLLKDICQFTEEDGFNDNPFVAAVRESILNDDQFEAAIQQLNSSVNSSHFSSSAQIQPLTTNNHLHQRSSISPQLDYLQGRARTIY